MKHKNTILLALLVAGIALAFFTVSRTTTDKVVADHSRKAPSFEVADLGSGSKVSSADLQGKVVFVNFWASWCQPCKDEMSSVDQLYREKQSSKNFVMLTILYKDSPSNAVDLMKANGYSFPVYADVGENSARAFGVTGVPETYIIDKNGTLRKRVIGPAEWTAPEEKALIDALLKE